MSCPDSCLSRRILTSVFAALLTGLPLFAFEETTRYETKELIGLMHSWDLYTPGEVPPANWVQMTTDLEGWTPAPGVVAHLTSREALERMGGLSLGTELPSSRDTFFLRTEFTLDELPPADSRLILDFILKDGAVFYLNGEEVGRSPSMPRTGPIDADTQALTGPRMRLKTGFFLNPQQLRRGTNVLAVSLHGYDDPENSPDRILAMQLTLIKGWTQRPELALPRHVRVLWGENPQEEAVISWTTSLPGTTHVIHFDTARRFGRIDQYAHSQPVALSGEFRVSGADVAHGVLPGHYHHGILRNLEPDTSIYFVVESDGEISREYWFRTAPADDRPIKLIFGGDSRIGGGTPYFHHDRRAINRRIAALTETHPEVLAFLHGGDVTQRAQWRYFGPWLTDHELTYTQDGRILPIMIARGNHDMDVGFEEVFHLPEVGGNRFYYAALLTERVGLITLNTEISHGGHQRRFLEQQLQRLRPQTRWLLLMYHKPAWPSVRGFESAAPRQRFWVPLFEQYKIDLGLESHDHALKRTVPILNNRKDPEGIVYIGDGGLGVPQRNPDATRWYFQDGGIVDSVHHVHILEIGEDALVGTAYTIGGEIVDQFTLFPRKPPFSWAPEEADSPSSVVLANP